MEIIQSKYKSYDLRSVCGKSKEEIVRIKKNMFSGKLSKQYFLLGYMDLLEICESLIAYQSKGLTISMMNHLGEIAVMSEGNKTVVRDVFHLEKWMTEVMKEDDSGEAYLDFSVFDEEIAKLCSEGV